jgi:hypothetical protein
MRSIRVLIGDVSDDVREWILSAAQLDPEVNVVGNAPGTFQILLEAGATGADVLMTSLREDGSEPGIVSHVLSEYPDVIVAAFGREVDHAAIFRLVGAREDILSTDPGELWRMLRERF